MNHELEAAVIRLANVLMPDTTHWLNDAAKTRWFHDREQPEPLLEKYAENPFGLSNAAQFAWSVVKRLGIKRSPI